MFALQEEDIARIQIRVLGIGGAGCNAVNTMIAAGLTNVEFVVANTDRQAILKSTAPAQDSIRSGANERARRRRKTRSGQGGRHGERIGHP